MKTQEKINLILEHFDFEKTLTMMKAVGWTHNDRAVTLEMIKKCARSNFDSLLKDQKCRSVNSGGFKASRFKDEFGHEQFELEFVGVAYDTDGM